MDTPHNKGFRWWVIPLGAILIVPNSLWIVRIEALDYSGFPTCSSLFFNVVFSLMVLLLANIALRRFMPRAALTRSELLVIYAMLATGSSLVGHDTMQMVVTTIPHVTYFGTPENHWHEQIGPLLPHWLTIGEPSDAVNHYEQGFSTLYLWENFRVWLIPIAAWSAFLLAMIASMLSINIILRRHWVEDERLTYPIVQIPLLITEEGGATPLFRNRILWLGFSIAAGLDLWNGLAVLYPTLPPLNVKPTNLGYLFPSHPWNAIGWFPVMFYPFAIGISFFMPTNMAFSSWFFYLFRKVEQIAASAFGYTGTDPWYPYLKEQSFGALIALLLMSLWLGRGYLRDVWNAAAHGVGQTDDGGVSYRLTLIVLGIAMAVMLVILVAASMSPVVALTYLILYMLFCGAMTRIRAELGPPTHELGMVGPSHMLVAALGTSLLGPHNLAVFSLLHFQNRMHRGILMPQQAEALKAASDGRVRMRTMAVALAVAGVVGVLAAFWALLYLGYGRTYAAWKHPGAPGSLFSREAYDILSSWLNTSTHPNLGSITAMGIGAAVVVLLSKLNVAFCGFPFHPAGYALGMAFGIDYVWLPVMISWLCKVLILRYWGLKGYRASMPFFVGLVLGEFAMGGLWSFMRGILGVNTYTFFM